MRVQKIVMKISQVLIVINVILFGYMTYDAAVYSSETALQTGFGFWETVEYCLMNTVLGGITYLIYAIILYVLYKWLEQTVKKTSDKEEKKKPETLNIIEEHDIIL